MHQTTAEEWQFSGLRFFYLYLYDKLVFSVIIEMHLPLTYDPLEFMDYRQMANFLD